MAACSCLSGGKPFPNASSSKLARCNDEARHRGGAQLSGSRGYRRHCRMKGPLYGGEQNKAFSHVVFLTLSSFAYVSAWLIVGIGSSDFWVEAPLPNGSGYSPLIIGLLLMYLVHKNMLVPLIRWIALAGWITVVAGSLVYAGFGIKARAEATIGPVLRAQPVAQDCHGRRFFRTCATTFALGDGTTCSQTAGQASELAEAATKCGACEAGIILPGCA